MDRKIRLVAVIVLFSLLVLNPGKASADISTWQKGYTLRLNNQTHEQVDTALTEMRNAGVDYAAISPGWITTDNITSNVDRKVGTSPDALVIYTINKAHSLGMRVLLKPHLDIATGEWRAALDPLNKNQFFVNYDRMILSYANIAQQTNTEEFSVGAELVKLSTNPDNTDDWKSLVAKVRSVYKGKLTYSANADEYGPLDEVGNLTFWDDLDYVGMSFYRPLSENDSPTVDSMKTEWQRLENEYVIPRYNKFGQKPMLFTEVGYRSLNGASLRPYDYQVDNKVDTQEQKDLYQAFFEFWKDKDYVKGVNFWEWNAGFNINPLTNKDYTPQKKPALDIVKKYFLNGTAPVTPPEVPELNSIIKNLNRYINDKINRGTVLYSDRSYVVTDVPAELENENYIQTKNSDKSVTLDSFLTFDLVQKAYVYVAYDQRASVIPAWLSSFTKTNKIIRSSDATFNIYQKLYDVGQVSLGSNLASPAKGAGSNYFVIVSTNKLSDDVPQPTPPVTPGPTPTPTDEPVDSKIVIESPDNNSRMDGEKKLKIYVEGLNLDDYTATYNVDNRGAVNMPNDLTLNYKQAKIDFEQWTWNGDGPYNIKFEAKDLDGAIIDSASLTLYVVH